MDCNLAEKIVEAAVIVAFGLIALGSFVALAWFFSRSQK